MGSLSLLKKNVQRRLNTLNSMLENSGFHTASVITIVVLVIIWAGLIGSIYNSVIQTAQNQQLLRQEKSKLELERVKSEKLAQQYEYYTSIEYRQRYAYDSLSLARPGEKLYSVEIEPREEYELQKKNPEPVRQGPEGDWWTLLFSWLGIGLK